MVTSRARVARRVGGVVAGLVAIGALAPAAANAQAPGDVTAGDMDWGFKASWRAYVASGNPPGTTTVSPPASTNADGTYDFPNATGTYDADAGTADVAYQGSVNWVKSPAPSVTINVTLANPELAVNGDTAVLSADMTSTTTNAPASGTDVAIANIDLTGIDPVVEGDQVTISTAAAANAVTATANLDDYFGRSYPEGTVLDPITTTFTVQGEPDPEPRDPIVRALGGVRQLDGNSASVARVKCPDACDVEAPSSVKLKAGKKSKTARLVAPDSLEAGESSTIEVRLKRKQARSLKGETLRGAFRLGASSDYGEAGKRIAFKVKVPKR